MGEGVGPFVACVMGDTAIPGTRKASSTTFLGSLNIMSSLFRYYYFLDKVETTLTFIFNKYKRK